jgi:hypothetical protein
LVAVAVVERSAQRVRDLQTALASPRKNLSQGPSFGSCGFVDAVFKVKIVYGADK